MKNNLLILVGAISSVIILMMAGCGRPPEMAMSRPVSHAWEYMTLINEAGVGYATYSYVLFGKTPTDDRLSELYKTLISEIKSVSLPSDEIEDEQLRALYNLFLLIDPYDEDSINKSKKLLLTLKQSAPNIFSGYGPYIVTLYEKVSDTGGETYLDLLYVDVSKFDADVIPLIVKGYTSRVEQDEISGQEKLSHRKASLLNFLIKANDSFNIAKIKLAKFKPED